MVPYRNCAGKGVAWGFCTDLGKRSMLITAQIVPFCMITGRLTEKIFPLKTLSSCYRKDNSLITFAWQNVNDFFIFLILLFPSLKKKKK